MSSSLTTLVPILSGPNYQVWSTAMKSFLMSQGQWRVLSCPCPKDITVDKDGNTLASDAMPSDEDVENNKDKIEDWEDDNQKAVGNIMLRLAPQIQGNLTPDTMDGAGLLWAHLETHYGKPGIIATYLEFKAAMDIKISDQEDPTIAIDKMMAHFAQCNASGLKVPDHFQAMVIMAKLPNAFNDLAQIFCQKESVKSLDVADMRKTIGLAWEQRKGGKAPRNQAQKLSTVKRRPNEPPFKQQQGDGQRGGRRRRGNRGGRGRNQQGPGNQAQPVQQSQPQAGPSQPPPAPPAPTLDTFQFGHITSPVVSFPPPPPSSFYPSFNKALSLARRIGATPTTQTLKQLEGIERPSDPRPLKKHSPPKEDKVSLDWSGNEDDVDIFMEESAVAGPSGTSHRYVRNQKANVLTDVTAVIRTCYESLFYPNHNTSFVCCPLRVNEDQSEATWMLDSGASCHFTNDINDFVEFEENVGPEQVVRTANGSTSIAGKGTVIFTVNGDGVRLYPVFYIPDLNDCLLSLGQFHQSGLSSRGSAHSIVLYNGKDEEFLTFYPRSANSTIYVIQSLLGTEVDYSLSTVYNVDFEIMHRRLAHPSGEVLRKAGKYVKDFPDIKIPSEHFCPGCAQGKMTQKPFPASETRATEPFELIHSDLKMQPVKSYRKYRYTITFLDDFTSHAWTINLRTKDAALPATHHFLAMVETQYKSSVRAWMSDAGGEYTSMAFTTMMKEKGVTVLQSVPHAHQQNGRTERLNRTLSDKAESLRLQACLPPSWWEFALDHATHVYNQMPMK